MDIFIVNELLCVDCINMYSRVWIYVNVLFRLCTYTGLLCGYTLVHIYCGHIDLVQSKIRMHFTFFLLIVAIHKH